MNNQNYIISLSFSNYLNDKSGMPKVIMAHQKVFNRHGVSYVYLYSVKKTAWRDDIMFFCEFGLIIDGERVGIFSLSDILRLIAQWNQYGHSLKEIHIHHLLYVRLNEVERLLSFCKYSRIKVFLHDYYLCCTSYNLQKGETFCGATYLGSKPCLDCDHFRSSRRIEDKINTLFDSIADRVTFVAPSADTLKRFISFHPNLKDKVIIVPHQITKGIYRGNTNVLDGNGKIRVAYLGMPTNKKGWNTWLELVKRYSECDSYRFFVFNSSDNQYSKCTKIWTAFSSSRPNAMVDALRENQIAITVLWQRCPETYSYTCMEAYSSNTFIVTNRETGNVADFVSSNSCGAVLNNQDELFALFDNCARLQMLIKKRKEQCDSPQELVDNDVIYDLLSDGSSCGEMSISHLQTRTSIIEKIILWVLRKIEYWRNI